MTDVLGRSWQLGTIQLDAQMPARFGLTYMGADNQRAPGVRHPPGLLRLVRALHRDPDRALRRRVPALARARAGARAAGQRAAPRSARRGIVEQLARRRVSASRSTSATRRSASGSATPSSRRSRSWSSSASASPRPSLAVRARGEGQSTRSLDELLAELQAARRGNVGRLNSASWQAVRGPATLDACKVGAVPSPPEPAGLRGVQPSRTTRERCRCLSAAFVV